MATIKDVARKAGVGQGTVSRVLNNSGYVSEEKRQRVVDAVKALNYVPSTLARAMVTKRSKIIGVILPDLTNPFFPMLVRGIEAEAQKNRYTVMLIETDWQPANEKQAIETLRHQSVDGMILVDAALVDFLTASLLKEKVPVVLLNKGVVRQDITQVLLNNYHGTTEAMTWIKNCGHSSIGMLAGPRNVSSADSRLRAYLDSMGWEHISIEEVDQHPELPVVRADFQFETGKQAVARLIQQHPEITCIFAANDLSALGALTYLASQGIRVPLEIALVGFDDLLLASLVYPALTTVRQPVYEMGTAAAQLLLKQIEDPQCETRRVVFDPMLIVRQSCEPRDPLF
jgi:DNA-binding LacI/PurR family transcriptional regulator